MIFTVVHSNRLWTEFLAIIKQYDISVLVDIRRFQGSRLWSQLNKDYLEKELDSNHINISTLKSWVKDEVKKEMEILHQGKLKRDITITHGQTIALGPMHVM